MDVTLPDGVGWTALITAYARAQESRRPDRLFDDTWARTVIAHATRTRYDAAGLPPVGPLTDDGRSELMTNWNGYFVVRTLFYDDHVHAGVAHGCGQVVLLAAGFDGRAQRLDLPHGITVFELDTEPVLTFKNTVLGDVAPARDLDRRTVPTDLLGDWPSALRAAGFDTRTPTVWLAEGLLMYLDTAQCDHLLDQITALSAPGSRFATEWCDRNPAGERSLVGYPDENDRRVGEFVGSLFRTGPGSAPDVWLAEHGWSVVEVDDVGSRHRRHGRRTPWVFDTGHPEGLRIHLVCGVRDGAAAT